MVFTGLQHQHLGPYHWMVWDESLLLLSSLCRFPVLWLDLFPFGYREHCHHLVGTTVTGDSWRFMLHFCHWLENKTECFHKPNKVCEQRLLSDGSDKFHFWKFPDLEIESVRSIIFQCKRTAVRHRALTRLPHWKPVFLKHTVHWEPPLPHSHHCVNHCHQSLQALVLVCITCSIKSWSHFLCN